MTTTEILTAANAKAANLQNNTMIRLTGEVKSYWIFRSNNKKYIGWEVAEPMPKFFANKSIQQMEVKGVVTFELQAL